MHKHDQDPVCALRAALRDALDARGMRHADVAARLHRDRSAVTRVFNGADVSQAIVTDIARGVGADADRVESWRRAAERARVPLSEGGPPAYIRTSADLLQALRGLVKRRGRTQAEIARRAALSASTVSAVLAGRRRVRPATVMAIVRACRVSPAAAIAWDRICHRVCTHPPAVRREREWVDERLFQRWQARHDRRHRPNSG